MFVWGATELNPEQAAAVEEPSSVFLVACPGSGKTRTLTYKIAYELSRRTDKRIVVAITYTHRAADEIQERVEALGVDSSALWIGTIHSFCLEWIIKPYGIYVPELARGYTVLDRHDREKMLERLCAPYRGVTLWDCDYYFEGDGYRLGCAETRKHDSIHQVLAAYFRELAATRRIDFELIQTRRSMARLVVMPFRCRISARLRESPFGRWRCGCACDGEIERRQAHPWLVRPKVRQPWTS